jgi:hypothetical protein
VDGPILGSAAIARGDFTRAELRSDRFAQVYRDVFVPAGRKLDLRLRSQAAALLVPPDGALSGYSAALLHGAACGPDEAPAELIAPRGDVRSRRGLRVSQYALAATEVCEVGGCRVTTPERTAYDLGRRLPLGPAVAAIDALARVGGFAPASLVDGPIGARGRRRLMDAVALSDPRAESVMESRLRVLLVRGGLPAPVPQYPVFDAHGLLLARVDLGYPVARLAIEYDGGHHFDEEFSRRDRQRDLDLGDLDWLTLRFTSADVLLEPVRTIARVRRHLAARLPTSVDNDVVVIEKPI